MIIASLDNYQEIILAYQNHAYLYFIVVFIGFKLCAQFRYLSIVDAS